MRALPFGREADLDLTDRERTSRTSARGGLRALGMSGCDMAPLQTIGAIGLAAAVVCAFPDASSSRERRDEAVYADLHVSLQNYVSKRWGRPQGETLYYKAKLVDLNGDERREAVVLVSGGGWCGTGGCPLWVLTPRGQSWRMVSQAPVVREPIRLLPTRRGEWSDLSAMLRMDGTIPLYEARLSVGGRLNFDESPLRRPSRGTVILSGDDRSTPLFP